MNLLRGQSGKLAARSKTELPTSCIRIRRLRLSQVSHLQININIPRQRPFPKSHLQVRIRMVERHGITASAARSIPLPHIPLCSTTSAQTQCQTPIDQMEQGVKYKAYMFTVEGPGTGCIVRAFPQFALIEHRCPS